MKRTFFSIYMLILLASVSSVFAVGEKTLRLGALSGWRDMEIRQGVAELTGQRPYPVMALASAGDMYAGLPLDMYLPFDEGSPARFMDRGGHYDLDILSNQGIAGDAWARKGEGSARFLSVEIAPQAIAARDSRGPLILRPRQGALFAPGNRLQDFSIDFWICPGNPENGEQILNWSALLPDAAAGYSTQRIRCAVSKNRLEWTFTGFFTDPQGTIPGALETISLTGSPVLPKTWSHHLIRFDSAYGRLEYLVDGRLEAVEYITSTGREGGEVYTPVIGEDSSLSLGSRFNGFIDEFHVYPQYLENPALSKYQSGGGRVESRALDLGGTHSRPIRITARGGRIIGAKDSLRTEYSGSGNFLFADYSELRFYMRSSDTPYRWKTPWVPVEPGRDFSGTFSGRYVQIALEFFPSGDGETTPYLEEIALEYQNVEPLPPPAQLSAIARDGAVELSWRPVADASLGGYLVYFGTSGEEYFGAHGVISSPLDAGSRTSLRIEGLRNGTLYYFTVASYDKDFREPGDFSRETAARPRKEFSVLP